MAQKAVFSFRHCSNTIILRFMASGRRRICSSGSLYSEKDGSHDSKPEIAEFDDSKPRQNSDAANKLKEMLLGMKKIDFAKKESNIEIPKPRKLARIKAKEEAEEKVRQLEEAKENELGAQLEKAAAQVAKLYGEDEKKIEMELLESLLSKHKISTPKNDLDDQQQTEEQHNADSVPEESQKPTVNLCDLISGMKIDKTSDGTIPADHMRSYQVKNILAEKLDGQSEEMKQRFSVRYRRRDQSYPKQSVNIFGGTPLGIFDVEKFKREEATAESIELSTWDAMEARDLKLCITHPPSNIYEQMIQWTDQGKLWKFPIDNEQDMPEELKVDFTEHIFLEKYLHPWCPATGPIRHLMELVCVGCSKNPYMTIEEKKWHILWFEEYFRSRNDYLIEADIPPILDRENTPSGQEAISS